MEYKTIKNTKKFRARTVDKAMASRTKQIVSYSVKLIHRISSLTVCLFALSAVSATAKDIPGATQTSYGVSGGGSFQFSMPIIIPQGTNGIQPNLSLSFSSAGSNGSAGVGWGVGGLSEITRCGKTFATNGKRIGIQHNTEDRFCLGGQQLILISGSYGVAGSEYRTEIDQFSKILAYGSSTNLHGGPAPARWQVKRKGGAIEMYGMESGSSNSTGQYKLPNTSSIHSWKLSRMKDRHGNYYEVTYRNDGMVDKIDYTINDIGLVADKQVKFNYEARPDTRSRYLLGSKIDIVDRLASITASKAGVTIREYNLNYETAPVTNKSRVTSITECGLNNTCMPPISVDWQTDTEGFASTSASINKAPTALIEHYSYQQNLGGGATQTNIKEINRGTWADVNGDGRVDLVTAYITPGGSNISKTYIKTDTGWDSTQSNWNLPLTLRSYDNAVTNMSTGLFKSTVINQGQMIDVNGDGLVDVVYAYRLDREVHQYADANNGISVIEDVKVTYLNTGNGWVESSAYKPKDYLFDYIVHPSVYAMTGHEISRGRFVDINGDGLVDWITAVHFRQAPWYSSQKTYINTGNGWTINSAYAPPSTSYFKEYYGAHNWGRTELMDVNGNGLLDWVEAYKSYWDNNYNLISNVWLNTGTSFTQDNSYKLPEAIYDNNGQTFSAIKRGSFVDVNGDGLRDFVRSFIAWNSTNLQQATLINKGKGWVANANLKPPFIHQDNTYIGHAGNSHTDLGPSWGMQTRGYYVDVNRDGFVDFTQSYKDVFGATQKATWLNDGSQWVLDNSFNSTKFFFDYYGRGLSKARNGSFVDINNDGSPDWVSTQVNNIATNLNQLGKADQVKAITTTMGVEVKPTFTPMSTGGTLYTKYPIDSSTGAALVAEQDSYIIHPRGYVVSELNTSRADGLAGYNTTQYRYGGAQVHRKGRGFLGYQVREVIDLQNSIKQTTQYLQSYPFIGRVRESKTTETDNANAYEWLSLSSYNYDSRSLNAGKSTFVFQENAISRRAELNDNGINEKEYLYTYQSATFDDFGNVLTSNSQVGSNSSNILRTTNVVNNYFPHDTTGWLISLLEGTTSTQSSTQPGARSPKTRKSSFTYDSSLLKTTTREPDSTDDSFKLLTTYTYDDYGNIEQEKVESFGANAQFRTNDIAYDTDYRLPETLTNSLGQPSSILYHAQCDLPKDVTDINGQVTSFEYDNFCRQTKVTASTDVYSTTDYTDVIGVNDCLECQSTPAYKVTSTQHLDEPVTAYLNIYGQGLLSETKGMLGINTIQQQTDYDQQGRVERQSQPFYVNDTKQWTSFIYDRLGRTKLTTLPYNGESGLATVSNTYDVVVGERVSKTTNTLGNVKQVFTNALGQITKVRDAYDNDLTYQYDVQGNLLQTTDAGIDDTNTTVVEGPNSIIVGYDLLGRRTSLNDPDMGDSSFVYDAFGQMTSQEDQKGQKLFMKYDELGRLIERKVPTPNNDFINQDESQWTFERSHFTFDTALYGTGLLHTITRDVGSDGAGWVLDAYSKTLEYDNKGRPSQETTTIRDKFASQTRSFTQSFGYDVSGRLASRNYPESGTGNPFMVKYGYDNGYLSKVSSPTDHTDSCNDEVIHWQADEYDALGRVKNETLGDMVATTRTYDPAQGVLTKIESIISNANSMNNGVTVQSIDYIYDANNNLRFRNDQITSIDEEFRYDDLDRLEYHDRNNVITTVIYDPIGNIRYKSDVGRYSYGANGAGPHALTRVELPLPSDPNVNDPSVNFGVNYDWDSNTNGIDENDQIIKSLPSIHGSTFVYDANGNVTTSGNRLISWNSFDKPISMVMVQADNTQRGSLIDYGAQFERIYKEEAEFNSLGNWVKTTESTMYIGKEYERITDATGAVKHRYTIGTGGSSIQVEREDGDDFDKPKYLLGDNLGSTNVILDSVGNVEQRLGFDPWGMRTNVGDMSSVNSITNKGYTGHEMDDEVGLVNMNARIYDPYLGRFLSADPVLPDAYDMQAFNRYSYVINNPLKLTDPTGNMPEGNGEGGCDSLLECVGVDITFGSGDGANYDHNPYADNGWIAYEDVGPNANLAPYDIIDENNIDVICIQAGPGCGGGSNHPGEGAAGRGGFVITDGSGNYTVSSPNGDDDTFKVNYSILDFFIPSAQAAPCNTRVCIFNSALSDVTQNGLLRGNNVTYVDQFAVALLDKNGGIVKTVLFGTKAEADIAVSLNPLLQHINGETLVGSKNVTVYAGATLAINRRIATTDFGTLRPITFTQRQNAIFVILHEIHHGLGEPSETAANRLALGEMLQAGFR